MRETAHRGFAHRRCYAAEVGRAQILAAGLGLGIASGCATSPEEEDPLAAQDTDVECGDLGCSNGLRISFVAEGGVFTAGEYELHIERDGVPTVCGFELGGDPRTCLGDPPCVLQNECGVQLSAGVVPQALGITVGPQPTQIVIGVVRSGRSVGGATLTPSYEEYAPNGADCDPICYVASAELPIGG